MRQHPHRLQADDYLGGHRYSLTLCTHRRRDYFRAAELVATLSTQILQSAAQHHFAVLAYCFMPDHLHAILEGLDDRADLPRFVHSAKQRTGFWFKRRTGHQLWQEGYFDRTLRRADALPDVIRYVIANPVRAGLVEGPEEYPHWGSGLHTRKEILDFLAAAPPRA